MTHVMEPEVAVATAEVERPSRYVVVPADNVFNQGVETSSFQFLSTLSGVVRPGALCSVVEEASLGSLKVLDRVDLNEATLVEMSSDQADRLRQVYPSLNVAPERVFDLLRARLFSVHPDGESAEPGQRSVTLAIVGPEGEPVPNVRVDIAFDPQRRMLLRDLESDEAGEVSFSPPDNAESLSLVSAVPWAGYWNALLHDVDLSAEIRRIELVLQRIAPGHRDAIDVMCDWQPLGTGAGVRIAIVDSGISLPADIAVAAGINTVESENPDDVYDNGTGHGTHIAGIVHRVAPEAEIVAYRVSAWGSIVAEEFPIAKAIHDAVDRNCDIISLSLGQANEPLAVTREIRRARSLGVVVVAATGNDWGASVSYPARTLGVLGVAACGDLTAAPEGAIAADVATAPPDNQAAAFHARFSNVGPEVDFTAPGVGIISHVSPNEMGAMDGTSMAAPVVAGLIARLLSASPEILNSARDQERSDEIFRACHQAAQRLGFGRDFEGSGMIRA